MIGKLRGKMEEERQKIESKKEKEGFFQDEVNDIFTKYILQKLRINSGMDELFGHATELDSRSNKIAKLLSERERLLRNLTTNLYILVENIKKDEFLTKEAKQKILEQSASLFSINENDAKSLNPDNVYLQIFGNNDDDLDRIESLQTNLNSINVQNQRRRSSQSRRSNSPNISPEEMTKLKNRLVSMIKTEQDEKPFKKILQKKIAKYEVRLKNRTLKSMKTHRFGQSEESKEPRSSLHPMTNTLSPAISKLRYERGKTMLKKRKSMKMKSLI
jgi:hypothetical protein